jgi:hypothetical protein
MSDNPAKPLISYISRPLQQYKHDEQELQRFFELYGPSARDCYAYCADLPSYRTIVRQKIQAMTWGTITNALTGKVDTLRLDEGSHKVILISPDPEDRENHLSRLVTKNVGGMVAEQDTNERWRNAHQLFHTMRLDVKTKSGSGWLLEPPFHALCVKGATFTLYPMKLKPGGRTNDTFIHSAYTTPESLVLPKQKRVVFDSRLPIERLESNTYYQPTHGSQPSFDSFIYDPAVPRITMFQVTDAESHLVKLLGISFILQLSNRLGLPVPELRFVAVVPAGDQVECVVPMEKGFLLAMFCIEVTEAGLFFPE